MTIREELEALRRDDGLLVAEDAVKWAARHKKSALHNALEWDDAVAAHQHRLLVVRNLIAIHIVSASGEREMVSLTIDRSNPGGGYRSIEEIKITPDLLEVAISDALHDLERTRKRYSYLRQLAKVWSAIEESTEQAKRGIAKTEQASQSAA